MNFLRRTPSYDGYDEAMNPTGMSLNGAGHSRVDPENMEIPLEFPTTNLHELEDRVFVDNWSIYL